MVPIKMIVSFGILSGKNPYSIFKLHMLDQMTFINGIKT